MSNYYSDEEYDRERIHIRHVPIPERRERSPAPVHYVQPRRERPRNRAYYEDPFHGQPVGHDRTMVTTTRVRQHSHERRSPPTVVAPPPPPVQMAPPGVGPVVINNNIRDHHHHLNSSDEESIISGHHHRSRSRHGSMYHARSHSRSHSRSRTGSDAYMTVDRYAQERQLEDMRRQLEQLALLKTQGAHTEREKLEFEQLRRRQQAAEAEREERERRQHEAEVRRLRGAEAELERIHAEKLAMQHEAHELEDFHLRESAKKLRQIELQNKLEKEAHERARDAKTHAELKAAKDELDRIHKDKEERAERDRIIKEHALAELEKKQAQEAAEAARKKADAEAVQRWHIEKAEKEAKEKKEKEEAEAQLRQKMRERLLASGVPEHQIQAMIDGKRPMPPPPPMMPVMGGGPVQQHHPHHHPHPAAMQVSTETKTTYTRMARKHLSLEALRVRAIEYELDSNPDYILIKRWVPKEEQNDLWTLTKVLRGERERVTLHVEDRGRHHRSKSRDKNLVLVRSKHRSKSPGLLTYIVGGGGR